MGALQKTLSLSSLQHGIWCSEMDMESPGERRECQDLSFRSRSVYTNEGVHFECLPDRSHDPVGAHSAVEVIAQRL
jgi:hypothetical protein